MTDNITFNNDREKLKYELLKWAGDLTIAKAAYAFVIDENSRKDAAPAIATRKDMVPDGIYYVMKDNSAIEYLDSLNIDADKCAGIGIKLGSRSLVVALRDAAEEATPLTCKEDETGCEEFYIKETQDAVADLDGVNNTRHLKDIDLHPGINLQENQYIPSVGEMLFIFLHLKAVNNALEKVGGQPLEETWYWTSTEASATNAWGLNLNDGFLYRWFTKASSKYRVRAVSAFIG